MVAFDLTFNYLVEIGGEFAGILDPGDQGVFGQTVGDLLGDNERGGFQALAFDDFPVGQSDLDGVFGLLGDEVLLEGKQFVEKLASFLDLFRGEFDVLIMADDTFVHPTSCRSNCSLHYFIKRI